MPIRLKVAKTEKERQDIYKLRYDVFVVEDGRFNKSELENEIITDEFDKLDTTVNIIAYEHDVPVGTIRINRDSDLGLPPEKFYNFSLQRESIKSSYLTKLTPKPSIVSPGMLAVRKKWRGRRDVTLAMFKLGIGIAKKWHATHCFAAVNHEYISLFKRVKFNDIDKPILNRAVGNFIIPMVATFSDVYDWAFGDLVSESFDRFWLDRFCGNFERVLLKSDEVLFLEGEYADNAYIIDKGWMQISRMQPTGEQVVFGNLPRGAILGEAALIGQQKRSATATAPTNVELIVLKRDDFRTALFEEKHEILDKFLEEILRRINRADDLAMVTAYSPNTARVRFSLNELRKVANPDKRRPGTFVTRVSPKKIAQLSSVDEQDVKLVLESEKLEGRLEFGQRSIRFLS